MATKTVEPGLINSICSSNNCVLIAKGSVVEKWSCDLAQLSGCCKIDGEIFLLKIYESRCIVIHSGGISIIDMNIFQIQDTIENYKNSSLHRFSFAISYEEGFVLASKNGYIVKMNCYLVEIWSLCFHGLIHDIVINGQILSVAFNDFRINKLEIIRIDLESGKVCFRTCVLTERAHAATCFFSEQFMVLSSRVDHGLWKITIINVLSCEHERTLEVLSKGRQIVFCDIFNTPEFFMGTIMLFDNGDLLLEASGMKFETFLIYPSIISWSKNDNSLFMGPSIGGLLRFSFASKILDSPFAGGPVYKIQTYRKFDKSAVVSSSTKMLNGMFKLRHGIRADTISKSEISVRGCCGLWSLKKYRTDVKASYILLSFPFFSSLFLVSDLENLTSINDQISLRYDVRTIIVANSGSANFIIQVHSLGILAARSVMTEGASFVESVEWNYHKTVQPNYTLACVIDNIVCALEANSSSILILRFHPSSNSGPSMFHFLGSIPIQNSEVTAIDLVSITLLQSKIILCVSTTCFLGPAYFFLATDGNLSTIDKLANVSPMFAYSSFINSLKLNFNGETSVLTTNIGMRDGTVLVTESELTEGTLLPIKTCVRKLSRYSVADSNFSFPVVLYKFENAIFAASEGLWTALVDEKGGSFQRMMNHVDLICPCQKVGAMQTFFVAKNGYLQCIESGLSWDSWLEPWIHVQNMKNFMFTQDEEYVIVVSDCIELFESLGGERRNKTDYSLKGHVGICAISNQGHFVTWEYDAHEGTPHTRVSLWRHSTNNDKSQRRKSTVGIKQSVLPILLLTDFGIQQEVVSATQISDDALLVACREELIVLSIKITLNSSTLQIKQIEPCRSRINLCTSLLSRSFAVVATVFDGLVCFKFDSTTSRLSYISSEPCIRKVISLEVHGDSILAVDSHGSYCFISPDYTEDLKWYALETQNIKVPISAASIGNDSYSGSKLLILASLDGSIYEAPLKYFNR